MTRFFQIGASALLLAACTASTTTVTYEFDFDTDDAARQADLAIASVNVINRRIEAHGTEAEDVDIDKNDEGAFVHVTLDSKELADQLTQELTGPFVLDFMIQSEEGEPVDAIVEKHGNFRLIDFNGSHIDWVLPSADETDELHGRLLIGFTDEGVERMHNVFAEHTGKFLGMFVRGQLAAKIKIEDTIPDNAIVISGLPNQELAEIFADDVNVGLHVTFVPVE